jgi:hypothetical protein
MTRGGTLPSAPRWDRPYMHHFLSCVNDCMFLCQANSDVVKLQTESNCKLLVDENNIRIVSAVVMLCVSGCGELRLMLFLFIFMHIYA